MDQEIHPQEWIRKLIPHGQLVFTVSNQSFPAYDGRMIHSCSPAALAAGVEGGGKSRRRKRPTRNCILLSFSYLFPIPTASHLSAHHFPRPTRSKSPKRWTAQGQGSHFTATGYVQLPWAIHHNRNLAGFPHKSTKNWILFVFP